MQTLYEVFFGTRCVAVCFDRQAAEALVQRENDQADCDILDIIETPLIDNYGFPFEPRDIPKIWPHHFD